MTIPANHPSSPEPQPEAQPAPVLRLPLTAHDHQIRDAEGSDIASALGPGSLEDDNNIAKAIVAAVNREAETQATADALAKRLEEVSAELAEARATKDMHKDRQQEEIARVIELRAKIAEVTAERNKAWETIDTMHANRSGGTELERVTKERDELVKLAAGLRHALITLAPHIGASVSGRVSNEFLMEFPEQARLHAANNRKERDELRESSRIWEERSHKHNSLAWDALNERDELRRRVEGLEQSIRDGKA